MSIWRSSTPLRHALERSDGLDEDTCNPSHEYGTAVWRNGHCDGARPGAGIHRNSRSHLREELSGPQVEIDVVAAQLAAVRSGCSNECVGTRGIGLDRRGSCVIGQLAVGREITPEQNRRRAIHDDLDIVWGAGGVLNSIAPITEAVPARGSGRRLAWHLRCKAKRPCP